MSILYKVLKNLSQDKEGVTALEYALLGALIAVVIIGAVTNVGLNVQEMFTNIADQVATVVASAV